MDERRLDEYHLDGNAAGGPLSEVFGQDVTAAEARCAACGAHGAVGGLMVYNRPPDVTLRCPGCGQVLLVIVRHPGGYRLTFDRLRSLDLPDRC